MNYFYSLRVPDDGISLHELLSTLKHSHIVLSQYDLDAVGTEKGDEKCGSRKNL